MSNAWPKWHRPYANCSACRGVGCDRCEGAHQNDYLAAHSTGAFAQYFAIACNPLVLVSTDPKRANQMALWAREEMTEAGLTP